MGEIERRGQEYACLNEHQVMHRSVESLNYTPETNITPYVIYTSIKKIKIYQHPQKRKSSQELVAGGSGCGGGFARLFGCMRFSGHSFFSLLSCHSSP